MKRLITIITVLFIILPVTCWFFRPSLSGLDFISVDCTIFGISLALITFLLPLMSSFRNKLMEFDEERILNDCNQLKTFLEILRTHQDNAEISNQEIFKDIDAKISKKINELLERVKHPEFISDTITSMFSGFESLACWCIVSIVILVVAQEVVYTSDIISGWCKSVLLNVFSEGMVNDIFRSLLAYLKLSSLSLQLIFLHSSCQNVFQWVRLVKIG